ncbi:MAG: fibrobacter succinogenes major paralogous domain-containing protein [Candidatus Atribacteria bacterium]|nr:fibrobacter succinogenes major paralogous domain-containing protein [Candidatus Atribacteria bacterium]
MHKRFRFYQVIAIFFLLQFSACCKDNEENLSSTITDIDGNSYQAIKIGNKWWMAENLKTTKYNDGIAIPNVTDNTQWEGLTTGAYCWYNNDGSTYKDQYGALYNWHAISSKLCPIGWHVPADVEWKILEIELGMTPSDADSCDNRGTDQGLQLKVNGTSGFNGELAGARDVNDGFIHFSEYGYFWTSTTSVENTTWAYDRILSNTNSLVRRYPNDKKDGFSIRCVKD